MSNAFEEALKAAYKKAEKKIKKDNWLSGDDLIKMIDEELMSRNIYPIGNTVQPWVYDLYVKGFTTPIIE